MIEVKEAQENMDMTEEEFKGLAKKVLPHLYTIIETAREYLPANKTISITLSTNGFIDFAPYGSDWELVKGSKENKAEIRREFRFVLDDPEPVEELGKEDADHDAE